MHANDSGVFGIDLAAQAEQLRQSLQSHPNPDVAKGILMVLHGCDEDQAFGELLRVCAQEQVLLPDLADALVHLVGQDADALGPVDADGAPDVDARALAVARHAWGPALGRVKVAAGTDLLDALPWAGQRLAEAAEYITELLTPRSLVSLGLVLRPRSRESA